MSAWSGPNIEGDYDEIIEWLDEQPGFRGVRHVTGHGITGVDDEGNHYSLNWGLFSINPGLDGHGKFVCGVCDNNSCSLWTVQRNDDPEYNTHLEMFGLTVEDLQNPMEVVF